MAKYITFLQLKAARHALNMGVRDIAKILKVSKATISKTELGKTRDFLFKHSAALSEYFELNGIIFPNEYSIRYQPNFLINDIINLTNNDVLTRFQLITARYIMSLTQAELANLASIDTGVIARAEQLNNNELIKPQDLSIVNRLLNVFNEHKIEFPDTMSIFYKKYVDNKMS